VDDRRRFLNEARVASWLGHPHIVPIFAVGEQDKHPYIVMKLIGGPSLDRELGGFAVDLKAATRLVKTLAEAVHSAHQRETLHLDLKPSKVLIDESGEPHVTGFGLRKWLEADDEWMPSGAITGTPGYMAPEQAYGRRERLTPGHRRLWAGGDPPCLDHREEPVRSRLPGRVARTGPKRGARTPVEAPSRNLGRPGAHRPEVPGGGAGAAIPLGR
jgi:serine/threonine protein kinase